MTHASESCGQTAVKPTTRYTGRDSHSCCPLQKKLCPRADDCNCTHVSTVAPEHLQWWCSGIAVAAAARCGTALLCDTAQHYSNGMGCSASIPNSCHTISLCSKQLYALGRPPWLVSVHMLCLFVCGTDESCNLFSFACEEPMGVLATPRQVRHLSFSSSLFRSSLSTE
jgi:hypothetical protein